MKCISCGKEISINAKICPYCQRDTTASTQVQGGMILFALVGGGVGYVVNGYLGAFIGAVLLGGVGGAILFVRAQKKHGGQPSTVRIAGHSSHPGNMSKAATSERDVLKSGCESGATSSKSPSARLQEIENLKASGLLTELEYNSKRSQILNEL